MNRNSDVSQGTENSPPVKTGGTALSRRALLRAGAGASPVLLTLVSGPISANTLATNTCTVASSFVSVATFKSRNPNATSLKCSTQNADYWRGQAVSAPATPSLNVTVGSLLGATGIASVDSQIVKDVLLSGGSIQTTGPVGTQQHLIALALNLNAGNITPGAGFNLAYVQEIWTSYRPTLRYLKPASQINWGDAEIIAWARLLLGYNLLP